MTTYTLTLNERQRAYLEELLKADLADTKVEVRHTHNPNLRNELRQREALIAELLEPLRSEPRPKKPMLFS